MSSATGPEPERCAWRLVAERAVALVGGNHEHGVAGLPRLSTGSTPTRGRPPSGRRAHLDDDHRRYLGELPLVAEISATRPSCTPPPCSPRNGTTW